MGVREHVHRTLRRLGLVVRRLESSSDEYQLIKDTLRASGADVVLDVGANVGQYGDLVLETGFAGDLVSFEAIPEVHGRLVAHARARSRKWVVAPCAALGSKPGETVINIAGNLVSSSLLPMRSEHVAAAPESAYVRTQVVKIERLDELARNLVSPGRRLMIKVDTQGYELEVLAGATGLLPQTIALQLELSLVPLYEGAPTFVEAIDYMKSRDFELFSIAPGFKDRRSGRLLQMDGIFLRRDV
ncbi:MAG TPA: FkbM family methyltransferase [Steroidobacteraceae bacterium]|nr:FkbM family methyltransferase [Steroidobacteraceae bacterium]